MIHRHAYAGWLSVNIESYYYAEGFRTKLTNDTFQMSWKLGLNWRSNTITTWFIWHADAIVICKHDVYTNVHLVATLKDSEQSWLMILFRWLRHCNYKFNVAILVLYWHIPAFFISGICLYSILDRVLLVGLVAFNDMEFVPLRWVINLIRLCSYLL